MLSSSLVKLPNHNPIIIVDDNEEDLFIAERIYKKTILNNRLITLPSGYALLNYMERVEENLDPMPALILLDINMPGLKGFETLEKIRSKLKFKVFPNIVMFSHSNNEEDIKKAMRLGANGYQVKPYEITEYIEFFNSLAPSNEISCPSYNFE